MNVFILILYTFSFFSVSQGGIGEWWETVWGDTKKIFFDLWNRHPASRSIYKYLDRDVNPCDNFYKFACGKWIRSLELKYRNLKEFSSHSIAVNFHNFWEEAMEGKYNDESPAIHNIYKLYGKCKDLSEDEIGKCQEKILDFGFYALSSLFLRKSINKNEKTMDFEGAKELILDRLKEEFKLLIDEKKVLFTNETTEYFLDKLNSMKFGKNFDDYDISNLELMEKCYKNFEFLISHSNIHQTLSDLEFQKNKSSKNHKLKVFSSCEDKFFHSDEMLNALNEPSFSNDFPRSLNFGGLGHTIALLMLTPFSSHNYNRTFYSDNKNASKVAEESIKKITKKINCFVDKYGMQKESITNRYINGSLTLAGNIAENGGLKVAHKAYMKWLQTVNYEDIEVPAFKDFTNEQLFFIGFGRNYCEYKSKDYIENQMKIDDHPPAEIRTNVALSNYKPFSDAFNCPLKSKMNPEEKCELWKNH